MQPSRRNGFRNDMGRIALLVGLTVGWIPLSSAAQALSHLELRPLGEPVPHLAQTSDRTLQTLLTLVNTERQRAGLAPLVLSPQLTMAAQRHAQDMANTRRLSHSGSDGSTMRSRIDATGYRWTTIGENVAMGQPTPEAVMASWMASPGHRQNILNPNFTELGLGYALGGGRPYWVQVFAKPR